MKKCNICKKDKPLENFRKCGKKGNIQKYRAKCKDCEASTMKDVVIESKGNCCTLCGYSKCFNALELHHLDPTKKNISPL